MTSYLYQLIFFFLLGLFGGVELIGFFMSPVFIVFVLIAPVSAAPLAASFVARSVSSALIAALGALVSTGRVKQKPSELKAQREKGWNAKKDNFGWHVVENAKDKVLPTAGTTAAHFALPDSGDAAWKAYLEATSVDNMSFVDTLVSVMLNFNSFGANGKRTYFRSGMKAGQHPVYFSFPTGMTNKEFYWGIMPQYREMVSKFADGTLTYTTSSPIHKIGHLLLSWKMPIQQKHQMVGGSMVNMIECAWPGGDMVVWSSDACSLSCARDLDRIIKAMTDLAEANKKTGKKDVLKPLAGLEFFKW